MREFAEQEIIVRDGPTKGGGFAAIDCPMAVSGDAPILRPIRQVSILVELVLEAPSDLYAHWQLIGCQYRGSDGREARHIR